jgi:7-cyano-7-deazaguanine synthase
MNNEKKAVVLLSGGMDSAVCAAIARNEGYQVAALHLNYGQKTEAKELECFENLCKHYKLKKIGRGRKPFIIDWGIQSD